MKTASSILALTLGLCVAPAFAGDNNKEAVPPQYDLKSEVTLTGTIAKIREIPATEAYAGTHITFDVKGESLDVFLGPSAFLKFLGVTLREGEKFVEMTGAKVKVNGADMILGRELRIGKTYISLRDEKGFPNWLWMTNNIHTGGGL
jgi:hypothetical protein